MPPADPYAERAMLGSLLLERDAILAVISWFEADWFSLEQHVWIYEAIVAGLHHVPAVPPDISTVASALRQAERLDDVGGIAYLGELTAEVPSAVHVEYYARVVERTARLRQLIRVGGEITAMGYEEKSALAITMAEAERRLFAVTQGTRTRGYWTSTESVQAFADRFTRTQQGEQNGLSSGFAEVDRLLGGWQPSDLILLAARPGMGKTAFALRTAWYAAEQGYHVGFVSLEMSHDQLVQRLVSMLTGIALPRLRGVVTEAEQAQVYTALGRISNAPFQIDDRGGQTVQEIRSKARSLQAYEGCDLLVVDHLQIIAGMGGGMTTRTQELGEISRHLKEIAKELHIPVIALSQLNRGIENRAQKQPMLADLRESGSLEQDADVVLFLHREEAYTKETDKKGIAELVLGKHRNGALGTILLRFTPENTLFTDLGRGG
jgi:replicative DNA helicase